MERGIVFAGGLALIISTTVAWGTAAWGQANGNTSSPAYPARTTTDTAEEGPPPNAQVKQDDIRSLSREEMRNKPVYDSRNNPIATLKDVTGSPGQSPQAVLQTGGVLGVGGREVSVPLEKLEVAPDGTLILPMTSDQLKLLPTAN